MKELESYMERVIREAENIAYSTRMLEEVGKTGVIERENITSYEVIKALLEIAPAQTKDPRRRLDLEELRDYWGSHREAITARYPKKH